MKTQKTPKYYSQTHVGLALILIGLSPAIAFSQETTTANPDVLKAETRAAISKAEANDHKADLDALDREIDAIEDRLGDMPDGPDHTAAVVRLNALKDRRTELRKMYVGAKFDQLKADTRAEYEKVAAWTKEKYQAAKASIAGPEPETKDRIMATVNPTAVNVATNIGLYSMNPTPENKEEVKLALEALEQEIDRLEEHAEAMPDGEERTALERRIEAMEDRQDELEHDFTKARWDALVADVKQEWNELVH